MPTTEKEPPKKETKNNEFSEEYKFDIYLSEPARSTKFNLPNLM